MEKVQNKQQIVYGLRPVIEAVASDQQVERVLIQNGLNSSLLNELRTKLKEHDIPFQYVPVEKLNKMTTGNHQGVVATIAAVKYHAFMELVETLPETALVVLLDHITDVRNMGAIARTAECTGVSALILPDRGSAALNEDAIKTSSGALLRLPLCREQNLKTVVNLAKQSFDYFELIARYNKLLKERNLTLKSRNPDRNLLEVLTDQLIDVAEPLRGDWTADSGYEAGATLAADKDMTAVYVANDQMALGVIAALEDAGRRVPEDVSVVGVDDSLSASVPHNRLTTVRFDLFSRGRRAFEQALLGTSPNYHIQQIRIAGTLVERQTVADLR